MKKTNEELWKIWAELPTSDPYSMKSAFLAACEIKDKELQKFKERYHKDFNKSADAWMREIEELKERLLNAERGMKSLYDVLEEFEPETKEFLLRTLKK
jgi:TRAP-type C4-dicarboxylate transport system substrate-binding protein